jgi:hypothetical protein
MPLNGGKETQILDAPEFWDSWSVTNDGIYFLDGRSIQFFDFANRQKHPILTLDKDASGGLAISPDHKSLLSCRQSFPKPISSW